MIAQAGGLTYTFDPVKRQQPVGPVETQPAEGTPFDVPTPSPDKLANVEGLTSNYYNAYGRLKDFVTTMHQDYGVDVTKPDLTQEGGGQFHQAYQNMAANLQMVSQDLQQQRKWQEEAFTSGLAGKSITTFDPSKQLFRETPEGVVSTEIVPEVKAALEQARNVYGTQTEAETAWKNQILPLKQKLLDQQRINPENAEFYQRQIDALPQAYTWEKKGVGGGGPGGPGTKRDIALYEKPVVENAFYVPPSQVQLKVQNGQVYAFHPSQDESYGTGNITETTGADAGKSVEKKKEVAGRKMIGGKRYITFKPPFDDPKYDMEVTNFTADQSILPFLDNNPRYGAAKDFINEAHERKMWAKNKSIPVTAVLDMQTMREGEANRKLIEQRVEEAQKKYDAEIKVVQDRFKKASGGDRITIPTAQGDLIFKKNSLLSGFELMNPKLYQTITNNPIEKDDKLTISEINKILEQTGAFENVIAGIGALDISMQQESIPALNQAVQRGTTMGRPITPTSATKPTKNW